MGKLSREKREVREQAKKGHVVRQPLPKNPQPDRVSKRLRAIVAEVNSYHDKMDRSMFTVGEVVSTTTPLHRW